MGLFAEIRRAAARVAERAHSVHIDDERLESLASELASQALEPGVLDPEHHHLGRAEETLAYVVTLGALNFGSGWFPQMNKRPGCSGYFTMAMGLKERFEECGAWSASEIRAVDARECAEVFGQDLSVLEMSELMGHFAEALRQLGTLLEEKYDGRYGALVAAAGESAEKLVHLLGEMPYYRDVTQYAGEAVPLYKRAQLTASDLSLAFGGEGPGRFGDLDQLTIFADNLVPHVLRREGVLRYAPDLAQRIDREEPLLAGSTEEVEIRAVGLHAVERMVASIRSGGGWASAGRLDHLLWNRGQRPDMKAHPRHRARSVYY